MPDRFGVLVALLVARWLSLDELAVVASLVLSLRLFLARFSAAGDDAYEVHLIPTVLVAVELLSICFGVLNFLHLVRSFLVDAFIAA